MFPESVIYSHRMVKGSNLIRATGYLSLQLALLEDAVDVCATELGLATQYPRYADRGLTAKIGDCKAEALTLAGAGVDLGELPVLLEVAEALSQRARRSIHDVNLLRVHVENLADDSVGNTDDCMTPVALYGLVREVGVVAIRLFRLATAKAPSLRERLGK